MVDVSGFANVSLQLVWSVARKSILDASASSESLSKMHEMLLNDMERLQRGINTLLLKEMWASLDHLHSAFLMQVRGDRVAMLEYFRLARDNARLAFGVSRDLHWRTLATKVSMIACVFIHSDSAMAAKHLCCKFLQSLYSFDATADSFTRSAASAGAGPPPQRADSNTKGEPIISLRSAVKHALGISNLAGEILDKLPGNDGYPHGVYQTVTEINEWLLFSSPLPDKHMLVPTLVLGGASSCHQSKLDPAAWYAQLCRTKQRRQRASEFASFDHRETVFSVLAGRGVDREDSPSFVSASAGRIRFWILPSVPRDTNKADGGSAATAVQEGAAAATTASSADGCLVSIDLADKAYRVSGAKGTLGIQDRQMPSRGRSVCLCGGALFALCSEQGAPVSGKKTWLRGWMVSTPREFSSRELGDVFDEEVCIPTILLANDTLGVVAVGFKTGGIDLYWHKKGKAPVHLEEPVKVATGSECVGAACFLHPSVKSGTCVLLVGTAAKINVLQLENKNSDVKTMVTVSAPSRVTSICTDHGLAREWDDRIAELFVTGSDDKSITVWRFHLPERSVTKLTSVKVAAGLPMQLALCYPRLLSTSRDAESSDRGKITFWQLSASDQAEQAASLSHVADVDRDTVLLCSTLTSHGKLLTSSEKAVLLW